MTTSSSESISERVRFWEEQDKINQELIPRVIRQSELLAGHIAEHENLALAAADALRAILSEAREAHEQDYKSALETATAELRQHYDSALEAALQEKQQQYVQELSTAQESLDKEIQANIERAVATLNQERRKIRNLLLAITVSSGAIAVAALIAGLLL